MGASSSERMLGFEPAEASGEGRFMRTTRVERGEWERGSVEALERESVGAMSDA
jgi:hypothetical protein